jgi:hypothetical protein
MEVRVPDGEYHMRAIIARVDSGTDAEQPTEWLIRTLFGLQIGEGQEHHIIFTERRLEQLALTSGLVDVKVERVVHGPDGEGGGGGICQEGDGFMATSKGDVVSTAELVLTGKRGK